MEQAKEKSHLQLVSQDQMKAIRKARRQTIKQGDELLTTNKKALIQELVRTNTAAEEKKMVSVRMPVDILETLIDIRAFFSNRRDMVDQDQFKIYFVANDQQLYERGMRIVLGELLDEAKSRGYEKGWMQHQDEPETRNAQ